MLLVLLGAPVLQLAAAAPNSVQIQVLVCTILRARAIPNVVRSMAAGADGLAGVLVQFLAASELRRKPGPVPTRLHPAEAPLVQDQQPNPKRAIPKLASRL